jgi:GT2 family glycosyltransferase
LAGSREPDHIPGLRTDGSDRAEATVVVVVITHGRVNLLRQCVESVLSRTSPQTKEIVIWNNGSTDGTREYLDGLSDPRVRVVHHPENIGHNAYAEAVRLTSGTHIVELDDDVVGAPPEWDKTLLDAYQRLPDVGFLAADLEEDEHDYISIMRHRYRADSYTEYELEGIRLLDGPTGGGCAITDRLLYDRVGGFPQHHGEVMFQEEAEYIEAVQAAGYRPAVLADLRVHHTGGSYYGPMPDVKRQFWLSHWKTVRRRNAVKRFLLRVPLVPTVNRRLNWFGPVEWEPPRRGGVDSQSDRR